MSKKINLKNVNKIWHNSYVHDRSILLQKIGITNQEEIKRLVNLNYVELDSEIRYKLECDF